MNIPMPRAAYGKVALQFLKRTIRPAVCNNSTKYARDFPLSHYTVRLAQRWRHSVRDIYWVKQINTER